MELSALEPYRPIFITVGGLALLYAGHQIFRAVPARDAADCDDGACAPDGPARRNTRRLLIGALALYALAIVYPYALDAIL